MRYARSYGHVTSRVHGDAKLSLGCLHTLSEVANVWTKEDAKTEETMSSEGYIRKWSAGSEETQRKCAEIREKLDKSKAGQTVLSHIVSLDNLSRLGGKFESAPQQVIEFSRVLLTALRNREHLVCPIRFPRPSSLETSAVAGVLREY